MAWTEDDIATLRQIAAAGGSFTDAAEALEVTRNAVAGKARREGIHFACEPERTSKRVSAANHAHWGSPEKRHRHVLAIREGRRRWWTSMSPEERVARMDKLRAARWAHP